MTTLLHSDISGQLPFPNAQHGQNDPTLQAYPANADQINLSDAQPGRSDDEADPADTIRTARQNQKVDLAMLRLSFRNMFTSNEDTNSYDLPQEIKTKIDHEKISALSCSEINQLVSAVVRFHDDERELLGFKSFDPNTLHKNDPYQFLESLSVRQLIQFARQNDINIPDSIEARIEKPNPHRTR
jgi:hypothetical protein